jgi:plasmid stabilization system protein ParE
MAVKPLEIHPFALEELKFALSWYLERNEAAALKFAAELDRAMDLLIAAPQRWPAGEHGSRKFVLRRFPFAIFYREKQAVIQVLAIAHGHRRPGYWKDRL